jgi:hypothetical protein
VRVPKIAWLRRIRLPRMAAGGTTGWICLRNVNAGICVRSEGRRNQRRNGRQQLTVSPRAQGLLYSSQHDQVIALKIALHLCLPLTPHRSAQLCKQYPLIKQAREGRAMSRPRPLCKMIRQKSARQFNKAQTKERPPTHFQSDAFSKQAHRHKLTPKRTQLTWMRYPESRHTQYRLTTPPL